MDHVSNIIALAEFRPSGGPLSESSHRIANQLSMLVSAIERQIDGIRNGPPSTTREAAGAVLKETVVKILAVAHLHRRLAKLPPDGEIDLAELLIGSTDEIVAALAHHSQVHVRRKVCAGCMVSEEQASVLVQILCEIVMNAIKYAHPARLPLEIDIACERTKEGRTAVEIADDGVGLPEGFDEARDAGLGLKLVRTLARRIGASLEMQSSELGLSFRLVLPARAIGADKVAIRS